MKIGEMKQAQKIIFRRRMIEMPVHKVKGGYKFGKSGKTYRGKGAKKKAQKQARAIYAGGYKEKRK